MAASFPAKKTIGMCMADITRYRTSSKYLSSYLDFDMFISTSLFTSLPKISNERTLIMMYTQNAKVNAEIENFIALFEVCSFSEVNNAKNHGWKQNAMKMFGVVIK